MSPEEDPGLLGNLPRSRPGRRSDKRPAEAREAAPPAEASPPLEAEPDRVGGALKAASHAAGAGLRVANGMTREVLRRLRRQPVPAPAGERHRSWWQVVKDFYRKAYEDNVTGLAGMVAYNLLLSAFPLALLALFIAGRVLESSDLERSVLDDLQRLFPNAADRTLTDALDNIRDSSTGFGVVALVASVWIGSSFWGALDTACCRIYHVRCRSWVEQKRFALAMLVVVLLFMAATVAVPTLQSLLVSGTDDLPLGLSEVGGLLYAATLVAGLVLLFLILCIIYLTVPNTRVPWRAVWPGALMATLAIGLIDYAFPAYLGTISTLAHFGTTFVFVLIVLIWFYAVAIILLGGAIVNSMRLEIHQTGELQLTRG